MSYVLSGPLNVKPTNVSSNLSATHTMKTECVTLIEISSSDLLLKEELSKFWNYEALGIKDGECDMYDNCLKTIKQNES